MSGILWPVMFPPLEGLVVVDILVRFFAFDLPFEMPFLKMVLTVVRLTALPLGNAVVLEVIEVASVLVLVVAVLPLVVLAGAVRDAGGSVAIVCMTVGNIVVVSPVRVTIASGSAMFVRLGVGVASSSRSSLSPSSGVEVTNGCGVIVPVNVLRLPIGFMKLSSTNRSRCITIQSRSVRHIASMK